MEMFNTKIYKVMANEKETIKRVNNLLIVDESGSMSVIYRETLAGINETITTCQKLQRLHPELEQRITLVTFDSGHYKVHYDNMLATEVTELTTKQYDPHAATPLYDAIGKAVSKMNAQTEPGDAVLVTILTDGCENASKEYNLTMVKRLIGKLKEQGWTFTLIGTDDLDVKGMAQSMDINNHFAFCEDSASTERMFAMERSCRIRYNKSIVANDYCMDESSDSYFDAADLSGLEDGEGVSLQDIMDVESSAQPNLHDILVDEPSAQPNIEEKK